MNARYYVPGIGRFASADTIVPDPMNPQSLNRYSYVYNNPIIFTDPTGHCIQMEMEEDGLCLRDLPSITVTVYDESGLWAEQVTIERVGIVKPGSVFSDGWADDGYKAINYNGGYRISPRYWPSLNPDPLNAIWEDAVRTWIGLAIWTAGSQGWAASPGGVPANTRVVGNIPANDVGNLGLSRAQLATTPQDPSYAARISRREVEDPGPMHNFPYSFDNHIITTGNKSVKRQNYIEYSVPGTINGQNGNYEIGINPYGNIITHRFFRPQ